MLSANYCLPLCYMSKKMAVDIFKTGGMVQFEVGYISYPVLNQDKSFKGQVEKNWD